MVRMDVILEEGIFCVGYGTFCFCVGVWMVWVGSLPHAPARSHAG